MKNFKNLILWKFSDQIIKCFFEIFNTNAQGEGKISELGALQSIYEIIFFIDSKVKSNEMKLCKII